VAVALDIDPIEVDPPGVGSEALLPEPEPVVLPPPPGCPGSLVAAVVFVGSLDGSEVGGSLVLVGGSVVGGGVLVVGGSVVGGTVLVGGLCRCALVVGGDLVVEVAARLVRGAIRAWRVRVVVDAIELAGEISWRCRRVVVVVGVCAIASAASRGDVTKPTMLPPIAPISIAMTTLTHRRAATNLMGCKRRTPRFEPPAKTMISVSDLPCPKILEQDAAAKGSVATPQALPRHGRAPCRWPENVTANVR
jgi:hypothetical protein